MHKPGCLYVVKKEYALKKLIPWLEARKYNNFVIRKDKFGSTFIGLLQVDSDQEAPIKMGVIPIIDVSLLGAVEGLVKKYMG